MFQGPKPLGNGQTYCTICAMSYKGSATSGDLAQDIAQAQAKDGQTTWLKLPPVLGRQVTLEPAVAWGFFAPWSLPNFGVGGNGMCPFPIPLCWSHLMGANMMQTALQLASAGDVPEPPRGAVDLAERAAAARRAGREPR
jgi:hypothetical protein